MSIILFFCGIFLICLVLDYCVADDTKSFTRITFHDFYQSEACIIFLGTSHGLKSVNAEQLTKDMGKEVFNLCTSGQNYIEAYYVLKDAVKNKNIEEVFLELSPSRLELDGPKGGGTALYIISDYISSPVIKSQLIMSDVGPDGYINAFSRLRRNIDPLNIDSIDSYKSIVNKKNSEKYKDFTNVSSYGGRGQFIENGEIGIGLTGAINLEGSSYIKPFKYDQRNKKQWKHLEKIAELCRKKKIKLHIFVNPYPEVYLLRNKDYSRICEDVKNDICGKDFDFIDLNLVKDEYLKFDLRDFYNLDHLSSSSAERMCTFLAEYYKEPSKDYFCDDLTEKYSDRDSVVDVGYKLYYVLDNEEYKLSSIPETGADYMKVIISAISDKKIPVDVRLSSVCLKDNYTNDDVANAELLNIPKGFSGVSEYFDEIHSFEPTDKSDYESEFILPYDGLQTMYKVELLLPGSDIVIYEAFTQFDKK